MTAAGTVIGHPLTPMQAGMLFHAVSAPGTGVDVQHVRIDFDDELDVGRFRRAWQATADRHEILRARYEWEGLDAPRQVFDGSGAAEIIEQTLTESGEGDHEPEIAAAMRRDRLAGFDLAAGTPNRFLHFTRGAAGSTLVWSFHHILLDGRSFPIVLRDLFRFYDAADGVADPVGPPPRPLSDYLAHMAKVDHSASAEFWRQALADIDAPTPLAIAHADPPSVAAALGTHEIRLAPDVLERVDRFATRAGASTNTMVQLAWATVLHHYAGTERVAFGTTRACRHGLDGLEAMVGVFINTVPMVCTLTAQTSIAEALAELRALATATRPHENTPLAAIHRASAVPAGDPLFHTLVVFENYDLDTALKAEGGGWLGRHVEYKGQTNSPLTLMAYADADLRLRFEFDSDVVAAGLVERMAAHVATFLQSVVESDPTDPVRLVAYLTEPERRAALQAARWVDGPAPVDVARAIWASAAAAPDRGAIEADGITLSYADVVDRASTLARSLLERGVGAGDFVGVAVRRGSDLVPALLGVLRAGAAFVPIDPRFPRDRIAHMVTDSGMRLALTDKASAAVLPPVVETVLVDAAGNHETGPPPDVIVTPDQPAYAIYTSGSTGLPKGVVVSHRALSNFMRSMAREPGIDADDRLLAVTTVSFDISILELFLPLIVGAQIVIADDDETHDGRALAERLDTAEISVMQATPTTWRMLVEAGWSGRSTLRILCGGEALPRDLADQLLTRCAELWNMYGPTETTIWSSTARVDASGEISIGKPLDNTALYVLDDDNQPVPAGIVGQLWIGGDGVALGYHGRPELTAERFVADPFRATGRMYATGDQARRDLDGTLLCLGRLDHQVKLRGFRIEIGEVESVLRGADNIADAVVVARPTPAGTQQLVGYAIAAGPTPPSVGQLRKWCATKLPEYMVPATVVFLDAFPLTENKKVARNLLPDPGSARPDLGNVFVSPRNETERVIAEAFGAVLAVDRVGLHDSFFDLGGDSLLVMRLVNEVAGRLGAKLAVHDVFARRTVEGLAAVLDEAGDASTAAEPASDRVARRNEALARRRTAVGARRPAR